MSRNSKDNDKISTVLDKKEYIVSRKYCSLFPVLFNLFESDPRYKPRSKNEERRIIGSFGKILQKALDFISSGILQPLRDYDTLNEFFDFYGVPFKVNITDMPYDILKEHLYAYWYTVMSKFDVSLPQNRLLIIKETRNKKIAEAINIDDVILGNCGIYDEEEFEEIRLLAISSTVQNLKTVYGKHYNNILQKTNNNYYHYEMREVVEEPPYYFGYSIENANKDYCSEIKRIVRSDPVLTSQAFKILPDHVFKDIEKMSYKVNRNSNIVPASIINSCIDKWFYSNIVSVGYVGHRINHLSLNHLYFVDCTKEEALVKCQELGTTAHKIRILNKQRPIESEHNILGPQFGLNNSYIYLTTYASAIKLYTSIYKNVSELLFSIPVDSSAFCYNGKDVVCTPCCYKSLTTRVLTTNFFIGDYRTGRLMCNSAGQSFTRIYIPEYNSLKSSILLRKSKCQFKIVAKWSENKPMYHFLDEDRIHLSTDTFKFFNKTQQEFYFEDNGMESFYPPRLVDEDSTITNDLVTRMITAMVFKSSKNVESPIQSSTPSPEIRRRARSVERRQQRSMSPPRSPARSPVRPRDDDDDL